MRYLKRGGNAVRTRSVPDGPCPPTATPHAHTHPPPRMSSFPSRALNLPLKHTDEWTEPTDGDLNNTINARCARSVSFLLFALLDMIENLDPLF
jgi:hypothetical protein